MGSPREAPGPLWSCAELTPEPGPAVLFRKVKWTLADTKERENTCIVCGEEAAAALSRMGSLLISCVHSKGFSGE